MRSLYEFVVEFSTVKYYFRRRISLNLYSLLYFLCELESRSDFSISEPKPAFGGLAQDSLPNLSSSCMDLVFVLSKVGQPAFHYISH